jgi:hypothetical protein
MQVRGGYNVMAESFVLYPITTEESSTPAMSSSPIRCAVSNLIKVRNINEIITRPGGGQRIGRRE